MRKVVLGILLVSLAPSMLIFAAGVTAVSQKGRAFSVKEVTLARGDTLRFNNDDQFVHQIYIADGVGLAFESDEQPPAQTVEIRFPVDGRFTVRCHIHPKMLLNVEVR